MNKQLDEQIIKKIEKLNGIKIERKLDCDYDR